MLDQSPEFAIQPDLQDYPSPLLQPTINAFNSGAATYLRGVRLDNLASRLPQTQLEPTSISQLHAELSHRVPDFERVVTVMESITPNEAEHTLYAYDSITAIIKELAHTRMPIEAISKHIYSIMEKKIHPQLGNIFTNLFPNPNDLVPFIDTFVRNQDTEGLNSIQARAIGDLLDQSIILSAAIDNKFPKKTKNLSYALIDYLGEHEIALQIQQRSESLNGPSLETILTEKTAHFAPVSDKLRYSFQLIAYNEMPDERPNENKRGNFGTYLMSLFTSLERTHSVASVENEEDIIRTKTYSCDPAEIEVIVNINNGFNDRQEHDPRWPHATVGNSRSLMLIDNLKQFSQEIAELERTQLDDEAFQQQYTQLLEKRINSFDWIATEEDPTKPIRNFYIRLLQKGESLLRQGLNIEYIDCTDGFYLKALDDEYTSAPTQGSRRRLVQEAALKRLKEAEGKNSLLDAANQWAIVHDADSKITPTFITELAEVTDPRLSEPTMIITPVRFAIDTHSAYPDLTRAGIDMIRGQYAVKDLRNLTYSLKYKKNHNQILTSGIGTMSRLIVNRKVLDQRVKFSIEDNLGEDLFFTEKVVGLSPKRKQIAHPAVIIADRMRPESWAGNLPLRQQEVVKKISYIPSPFEKAIYDLEKHYSPNREVISPNPVTPENFPFRVFELMKHVAKTPQELELISQILENPARYPYTIKSYDESPHIGLLMNIIHVCKDLTLQGQNPQYKYIVSLFQKTWDYYATHDIPEKEILDEVTIEDNSDKIDPVIQ